VKFSISEIAIGLTIVSFGTSAPELVVNIIASFQNNPEITMGNVIGSNLLNILFVVGSISLVRPLTVEPVALSTHFPIMAGFIVDAGAVFLFTRVTGFWGFASVWILFGIGVGLQSPAYNSLVSKAVPENMRGMAFGLFWTSLGLISLPAPYLGAALWERFSPRVPFTITAILAFLAVIPVFFKFKLPQKEALEQGAESELKAETSLGD